MAKLAVFALALVFVSSIAYADGGPVGGESGPVESAVTDGSPQGIPDEMVAQYQAMNPGTTEPATSAAETSPAETEVAYEPAQQMAPAPGQVNLPSPLEAINKAIVRFIGWLFG